MHRMLELLVGVPLLLFGGMFIFSDIQGYMWIQADPEHRRSLFGPVGTMIGILPFIAGCWLDVMAVKRIGMKTEK